ncbi:hypothetical protein [Bdellovibrio sp. HCB337]|uniref:hypothetical protein n=1 Tax=Bdellovibrio sp. HCB337 TaxID=3394358 RepID=UPI0039A64B17
MKFLVIALSLVTTAAFAQSMGIKDIPADGDTTIKIQKGNKEEPKFEITAGEDEIQGDPAALLKEARESWKKACADWKKETKELNKENQVLTLNCGTMKCATTAMETTCESTGKHKIKTKIQ